MDYHFLRLKAKSRNDALAIVKEFLEASIRWDNKIEINDIINDVMVGSLDYETQTYKHYDSKYYTSSDNYTTINKMLFQLIDNDKLDINIDKKDNNEWTQYNIITELARISYNDSRVSGELLWTGTMNSDVLSFIGLSNFDHHELFNHEGKYIIVITTLHDNNIWDY